MLTCCLLQSSYYDRDFLKVPVTNDKNKPILVLDVKNDVYVGKVPEARCLVLQLRHWYPYAAVLVLVGGRWSDT